MRSSVLIFFNVYFRVIKYLKRFVGKPINLNMQNKLMIYVVTVDQIKFMPLCLTFIAFLSSNMSTIHENLFKVSERQPVWENRL